MSEQVAIQELAKKGYVVLKLDDLKTVVAEMVSSFGSDKRVKYLSRKEAGIKYGVKRAWFEKYEVDPKSLLKVRCGTEHNSKKMYLEQSIVNELKRQEV